MNVDNPVAFAASPAVKVSLGRAMGKQLGIAAQFVQVLITVQGGRRLVGDESKAVPALRRLATGKVIVTYEVQTDSQSSMSAVVAGIAVIDPQRLAQLTSQQLQEDNVQVAGQNVSNITVDSLGNATLSATLFPTLSPTALPSTVPTASPTKLPTHQTEGACDKQGVALPLAVLASFVAMCGA
jgi:hypothetical protein